LKNKTISFPEILYICAFMLYLLGSSIALVAHGIELSLWLMSLAVLINLLTTLLPWLGFNWLAIEKKGWSFGYWLSILFYFGSWGSFAYAMYFRLWRILPRFYIFVVITTFFWLAGLLIFIYTRHACKGKIIANKPEENKTKPASDNQKGDL